MTAIRPDQTRPFIHSSLLFSSSEVFRGGTSLFLPSLLLLPLFHNIAFTKLTNRPSTEEVDPCYVELHILGKGGGDVAARTLPPSYLSDSSGLPLLPTSR